MTGWIGVDLDGTIAHYEHGNFNPLVIGEPIPAMVKRVKEWLSEGIEVKIFTARAFGGNLEVITRIEKWCLKHIGRILEVTCVKDYGMIALYDDRAWRVEANTGRIIGEG